MQFKRKLDPKKGRSQSSGEDEVWFSSIRAFFYLLSSPSPVLYICDALLLILFVICVVVVVVFFFFFFPGESTSSHGWYDFGGGIIVAASQGVEEEAFNSGIIGEAEQSL